MKRKKCRFDAAENPENSKNPGTKAAHGGDTVKNMNTATPPTADEGDTNTATPPTANEGDTYTATPPAANEGDTNTATPTAADEGDTYTATPPAANEKSKPAQRFIGSHKNDILLAVLCLALAGAALLAVLLTRKEGAYITVSLDGHDVAHYPLNTDGVYTFGDKNGAYNIIKIENGYASVTEASCPDHICVNHRPVHYTGQTVVCLPNKLVVTVHGSDEPITDF